MHRVISIISGPCLLDLESWFQCIGVIGTKRLHRIPDQMVQKSLIYWSGLLHEVQTKTQCHCISLLN